jgi:ubiquinone/menaquinone biosynthesis C-methylase UbiE
MSASSPRPALQNPPAEAGARAAATPELNRIRAEFTRRDREIGNDFYGFHRPVTQYYFSRIMQTAIRGLVEAGAFPLDGLSVLDVGCGKGTWLLEFSQWGASASHLHGIDLDPQRVAKAREKLPAAELVCGNAAELPWPDSSFDVISQFTVFTSILDLPLKQNVAREMFRVLKPGGVILWYDFRVDNPRNRNVRGIRAAEISSLFHPCSVRLRSLTLAPPLARRITTYSWSAALLLEKLPFLRTHYLGIIRKPQNIIDPPA